jgi:hypothetical protein
MTDRRRYYPIEVTRINAEKSNGRPRGNAGASRTPPATASPMSNTSWGKTGTCRQRSDYDRGRPHADPGRSPATT